MITDKTHQIPPDPTQDTIIDGRFLAPVSGISIGACAAGIKDNNDPDMALFVLEPESEVAAVFTQNTAAAAPVIIAREHLISGSVRALLVNSGCANAGTGAAGLEAADRSCQHVAGFLGIEKHQVLPFSTGMIGVPLAEERLAASLPLCFERANEDNWWAAAEAIMTTDTIAKGFSVQLELGGHPVTVTGIAKGAGMLHPNMATMLAYIATDAKISNADLKLILNATAEESFHRITLDGDTSTNDSFVLIATGKSPAHITRQSPEGEALSNAVTAVAQELARALIRDSEGASCVAEILITGGASRDQALQVARTIALSPLVKTAFHARNPAMTIGRSLAAAGRSGLSARALAQAQISVNAGLASAPAQGAEAEGAESHPNSDSTPAAGPVTLYRHGSISSEAANSEEARAAMAGQDFTLKIELAAGDASASVWTADYSRAYIDVNAGAPT